MARLPTLGGDGDLWGAILNEYLTVEHHGDGTHNMGAGLVTENVHTIASSGAAMPIVAPTTATISDITLTANCALTLPAPAAGRSFTVVLRQDGAGRRAVAWIGSVKWPGGMAPSLTITANAVDVLSFLCVDGANWLGFLSGPDMK